MPENHPRLPVERECSTESAARSNGAGKMPALPACSNCVSPIHTCLVEDCFHVTMLRTEPIMSAPEVETMSFTKSTVQATKSGTPGLYCA